MVSMKKFQFQFENYKLWSDDNLEMKWWQFGNEVMTIRKWSDDHSKMKWPNEVDEKMILWIVIDTEFETEWLFCLVNNKYIGWFDVCTVYSVQWEMLLTFVSTMKTFKLLSTKQNLTETFFTRQFFSDDKRTILNGRKARPKQFNGFHWFFHERLMLVLLLVSSFPRCCYSLAGKSNDHFP